MRPFYYKWKAARHYDSAKDPHMGSNVNQKLLKKKQAIQDKLGELQTEYKKRANLPPKWVWVTVIGPLLYCAVKIWYESLPVDRANHCFALKRAVGVINSSNEDGLFMMKNNLNRTFYYLHSGNSVELMFFLLQIYKLVCDTYPDLELKPYYIYSDEVETIFRVSFFRKGFKPSIATYYNKYSNDVLSKVLDKIMNEEVSSIKFFPTILSKEIALFTGPPEICLDDEDSINEPLPVENLSYT